MNDPSFRVSAMNWMELRRVSNQSDLTEAARLRREIYASRYSLDESAWAADAGRDLAGHVFLARHNGSAVSTVRFLPLTSGFSELERLGILPASIAADDPTICEGGRLAARARHGQGALYGLVMQVWAAEWSLAHTPLRRWVAWSKKEVLRVHRRVGAEVLAGPLAVPALGSGDIFVVGGGLADVVDNGIRMGCEGVAAAARSCVGDHVALSMEMVDAAVSSPAGLRRAS